MSKYKKRLSILEKDDKEQETLIAELETELNLEIKGKQEAIWKLQEELDRSLQAARKISDRFAAVNLDDADSLYVLADATFKAKNFEKVLQILDYNDLQGNIRNAKKNLRNADNLDSLGRAKVARGTRTLNQAIENCMFAAQTAQLDNRHDKAEEYFELAIEGDSTNLDNLWDYAFYLQNQTQFNNAEKLYQECLVLTKNSSKKAIFLNNLGVLYNDKNELIKAEKVYNKALNIRRKLAKTNSNAYESNLASTLNNLGTLFHTKNEMQKAEKNYNEALKIYRKLAEKKTSIYEPDIASTLNNLGVFYKDKNELIKAEKAYSEALSIRRKLAEKKTSIYEPDIASTLNNLGGLFHAKNEMQKAEKNYNEALKIYRKLAKTNPNAYELNLASTLNNLGVFYNDKNELIKAEKAYSEALNIIRKLAEKNPSTYDLKLANVLNDLGILYKKKNELIKAEKAYNEALNIIRKAKENSSVYALNLAMTSINIAILYYEKYEKSKYEKEFKNKGLLLLRKAKSRLEKYGNLPNALMYIENINNIRDAFENHDSKQRQTLPSQIEQLLSNLQMLESEASIADSLFQTKEYQTSLTHQNSVLVWYNTLDSLAQTTPIIAQYLIEKYEVTPIALRKIYSQDCSIASFYALFAQDYLLAEQHAQKGLNLDTTQEWIKTNLAHALLFQGKYKEAEKIYLELKNSSYKLSDEKTNAQVLLQDFKALEDADVIPKQYVADVAKIKKLLQK